MKFIDNDKNTSAPSTDKTIDDSASDEIPTNNAIVTNSAN